MWSTELWSSLGTLLTNLLGIELIDEIVDNFERAMATNDQLKVNGRVEEFKERNDLNAQ